MLNGDLALLGEPELNQIIKKVKFPFSLLAPPLPTHAGLPVTLLP